MKPFNAIIAYTCKIYQTPNVLSEYDILWNNNENSGVSKGNYIWYEYDDPEKFYAVIQKITEFLKTMYKSLDQNSLLVEINGYIYNLSDYYVYRKFLDDFKRSYI